MEAAAAFKHPRLRLGALLLRNGLLTAEQLAEALEEREQSGVRIGEIVVQRGWVSDEDLARMLAEQFAIDFVDLDAIAPDPTTGRLLSIDVARRVRAVPVEVSHGAAVVAVADPTGEALEVLTAELDLPVELAVAPASAIDRAIDRIHPAGEEIESAEPESTLTRRWPASPRRTRQSSGSISPLRPFSLKPPPTSPTPRHPRTLRHRRTSHRSSYAAAARDAAAA